MPSISQHAILRPGALSALSGVLSSLLVLFFPALLAGGFRAVASGRNSAAPDVSGRPPNQHYILTKFVMVNPQPGEEAALDGKFMDMAGQELSSRIVIRASNDIWSITECGAIKSCEVLSIEISQDRGAIHYTAKTKLINPAPPDAHAPLKLMADCPIVPGATEAELLAECHVPQIREFARELASHDQSKHGGNQ
jgi:hypothetical protein